MTVDFKHPVISAIIVAIVSSLLTYFFVDRFIVEKSKVQLSIDIFQIINDIQPNVSIKLQEEIGHEENQLIVNFDFYNSGPYPVFVDELPKLKLFIPLTNNMVTQDKELVEGKEYEITQSFIKRLSPKQKITHTIGVTLKGNFVQERLFYGLDVKFKADPIINKLSKKLLSNYLNEEDVAILSSGSTYTYGLLVL